MHDRRFLRTRIRAALIAVAVAAPLAGTAAPALAGGGPGKPVTVMSRNIYLGADINRPVEAAETARILSQRAGDPPALTQQKVLLALGQATHATRGTVDATNFPLRAGMLADEIVEVKPDLVGLQEVALWRSGPVFEGGIGVPNATTVDYDYLEILLDALADRGADYTAVEVGDRADVEAPAFAAHPFDGTARDVRMTMRDVILMRTDAGLRVTDSGDEIFAVNLDVSIAGVTMNFDRGYHWVDVRAGAEELRFVNSHFEAFSSDIALAQAAEVAAATPTDRTAVFVCDCNSDPTNGNVKSHDTQAHWAPYRLLTGPAGFTDQWTTFGPHDLPGNDPGDTAGLNELVNEPAPPSFTHRIDLVLTRDAGDSELRVDRGEVVGNESSDRDPASGLWPSDHAGVWLRLRGF